MTSINQFANNGSARKVSVKKAVNTDSFGEPLTLLCNHGWVRDWQAEHADVMGEFDLFYGLVTLPTGGIEHRPAPRFTSVESLMSRRLFVRKRGGTKAVYFEICKEQNEIDYDAGIVKMPITLVQSQLGAFPERTLARIEKRKAEIAAAREKGQTPPPASEQDQDDAKAYAEWLERRASTNAARPTVAVFKKLVVKGKTKYIELIGPEATEYDGEKFNKVGGKYVPVTE